MTQSLPIKRGGKIMTSSKCFNDYAGDFSVFDWQPVLGVSMVFTQCMLGQATASVTLNKCREI